MPGREKEFSYNRGVSRKEKSFSFFATQNFAPTPRTFAVEPQPSVKNPALAAENLNHLTETRFFRQNTAIVGQKSIATAKNRFYSEKIGRVAPKPCASDKLQALPINTERVGAKSSAKQKNRPHPKKSDRVGLCTDRVQKNPTASQKNRPRPKKTDRVAKKPTASHKIRPRRIITDRVAKKPTASDSLPGFIDISGHSQIRAASIFNTDALLQDSYPFKIAIPLTGRCKHNSNLKININKEQGGFIWHLPAKIWRTTM